MTRPLDAPRSIAATAPSTPGIARSSRIDAQTIDLRFPCLDEGALGRGQRAEAAQGEGPEAHPDGVDVELTGGLGSARRRTRREQADARDHDDHRPGAPRGGVRATPADTTRSSAAPSAAGSMSSHSGHDPAYTAWSGVSGPASAIARPSGVPATRSASGEPSKTTAAGAAASPSRMASTCESRFTSARSGCGAETTAPRPGRRAALRQQLADHADDPLRALDDRRWVVPCHDQPVVLEECHLRRAGATRLGPGAPSAVDYSLASGSPGSV